MDEVVQGMGSVCEDAIDLREGRHRWILLAHSGREPSRQSVFGRLAGYEDTNDAERLSVDPAMRQVVGGRAIDHNAASTSHVGRFETEILTLSENQMALIPNWLDSESGPGKIGGEDDAILRPARISGHLGNSS